MLRVFVRPLWLGIGLQSSLLYGFSFSLGLLVLCRLPLSCHILHFPLFLGVVFLICQKLLEFTPPASISISNLFLVFVWISFSMAFLVSILLSIYCFLVVTISCGILLLQASVYFVLYFFPSSFIFFMSSLFLFVFVFVNCCLAYVVFHCCCYGFLEFGVCLLVFWCLFPYLLYFCIAFFPFFFCPCFPILLFDLLVWVHLYIF